MDNDPIRLRLARHNALHHGVADRIEFILADYAEFARSQKGREKLATTKRGQEIDVVFLSPPWGESHRYLNSRSVSQSLFPYLLKRLTRWSRLSHIPKSIPVDSRNNRRDNLSTLCDTTHTRTGAFRSYQRDHAQHSILPASER